MEQLALAMTFFMVLSLGILIFLYTPRGKKFLEDM